MVKVVKLALFRYNRSRFLGSLQFINIYYDTRTSESRCLEGYHSWLLVSHKNDPSSSCPPPRKHSTVELPLVLCSSLYLCDRLEDTDGQGDAPVLEWSIA